MRFVLMRRQAGEIEFGIIYGLIALMALLAGRFLPVLSLVPSCVFKALSGLPCPTCGSTRSIVCLSQGHVASALSMNPAAAVLAIGATLYLFYNLFTFASGAPRIRIALSNSEKDTLRRTAIYMLLANWLYLIIVKR